MNPVYIITLTMHFAPTGFQELSKIAWVAKKILSTEERPRVKLHPSAIRGWATNSSIEFLWYLRFPNQAEALQWGNNRETYLQGGHINKLAQFTTTVKANLPEVN